MQLDGKYDVMLGHKMGWHWFNTGVYMILMIIAAAADMGLAYFNAFQSGAGVSAYLIIKTIMDVIIIVLGAVSREHSYEFEPLTWILIQVFYGSLVVESMTSVFLKGGTMQEVLTSGAINGVIFVLNLIYYIKRKELFFDVEYVDDDLPHQEEEDEE